MRGLRRQGGSLKCRKTTSPLRLIMEAVLPRQRDQFDHREADQHARLDDDQAGRHQEGCGRLVALPANHAGDLICDESDRGKGLF